MTRIFCPPLVKRMSHPLELSHLMGEKLLIRMKNPEEKPIEEGGPGRNLLRKKILRRNLWSRKTPRRDFSEGEEEPMDEEDPEEDPNEDEEGSLEDEDPGKDPTEEGVESTEEENLEKEHEGLRMKVGIM